MFTIEFWTTKNQTRENDCPEAKSILLSVSRLTCRTATRRYPFGRSNITSRLRTAVYPLTRTKAGEDAARRYRTVTVTPVTPTRERPNDSPANTGAPAWAERCVVSTIRGIPVWGTILVAVVFTALGTTVDLLLSSKPGIVLTVSYFLGCVLAVALAQRQNLFGPMVQPPLVVSVVMPLIMLVSGSGGQAGDLTGIFLSMLNPLISSFPIMAGTTVATVGFGLLRRRVLEPTDPPEPDEAKAAKRKATERKATERKTAQRRSKGSRDDQPKEDQRREDQRREPGGSNKKRRPERGDRPAERGRKQRPQEGRPEPQHGAPGAGDRRPPPGRGSTPRPAPGRGRPPDGRPGGEPPRQPRRPRRGDSFE